MNIKLFGKDYNIGYIEKAVRFFEHLENHKEVKESPKDAGIPVCKICGKNAEQIYGEFRD